MSTSGTWQQVWGPAVAVAAAGAMYALLTVGYYALLNVASAQARATPEDDPHETRNTARQDAKETSGGTLETLGAGHRSSMEIVCPTHVEALSKYHKWPKTGGEFRLEKLQQNSVPDFKTSLQDGTDEVDNLDTHRTDVLDC